MELLLFSILASNFLNVKLSIPMSSMGKMLCCTMRLAKLEDAGYLI
jgi:hypothetical protein